MLQQFWVLTCTLKGATRCTVNAVVGSSALRMKEASDKVWNRIVKLEDMLRSGKITYEFFDAEMSRMKEKIRDENAEIPLPYTIKEKYLTHLDAISKAARVREKEIEKYVNYSLVCCLKVDLLVNSTKTKFRNESFPLQSFYSQ